MTPLHVLTVMIGAALAGLGLVTGHVADVKDISMLIIVGALGNAGMTGKLFSRDKRPPTIP